MEWTGEGILLTARPHGESSAIIEVLSPDHGLHKGIVRGGAGRRMAPVLQPGAQLQLTWRARLDAQLGTFTIEPIHARAAAIMVDAERLAGLNAITALTVFALPERDPHPRFYAMTLRLLDLLATGEDWFGAYLAWERLLLEDTGYGLDLTKCAVTGATQSLAYVSPRTGRAVTAAGAGEFADRLLPLPLLLQDETMTQTREGMAQGLRTTGHFLNDVLAPALGNRPLPAARARLVARF